MQDFSVDMPIIAFTAQDVVQIDAISADNTPILTEDETFLKVIGDLILNPQKDEEKPLPVVISTETCESESCEMNSEDVEEVEDEIPLAFLDNFPQVWEQVSNAPKLFLEDIQPSVEEIKQDQDLPSKNPLPTEAQSESEPLKPEILRETAKIEPEIASPIIKPDSLTPSNMLFQENAPHAFDLLKPLPQEINKQVLPLHEEMEEWGMPEIKTSENTPILPQVAFNHFVKDLEMSMPKPVLAQEITVPTEDADWGKALNQQIVWLGQQQIKSAQIKLNPEALGPLNIQLSVKNKEATLHIVSHSADVRDLIGHAIPELKERLHEQGLDLTKVNVEAETHSNQAREQHATKHQGGDSRVLFLEDTEEEVTHTTKVAVGLIDYFA